MLYDLRWERQLLTGLIAWLERQPSGGRYDFADAANCVIAQWLRSIGEDHYVLRCSELQALFPGALELAQGHPRTFGAALERARLLKSRGRKK